MQLEYEIIETQVNGKSKRKLVFQISDKDFSFKFILLKAHKISRYSLETFRQDLINDHSHNLNKHQGILDATVIYDSNKKTISFKTCTKPSMLDSSINYTIHASERNKEILIEAISAMIDIIDRKC